MLTTDKRLHGRDTWGLLSNGEGRRDCTPEPAQEHSSTLGRGYRVPWSRHCQSGVSAGVSGIRHILPGTRKWELKFIAGVIQHFLLQKQISHGDCVSVYQTGPWEALSNLPCVKNRGLIALLNKTKGLPASLPSAVIVTCCCEPC